MMFQLQNKINNNVNIDYGPLVQEPCFLDPNLKLFSSLLFSPSTTWPPNGKQARLPAVGRRPYASGGWSRAAVLTLEHAPETPSSSPALPLQ